MSAEETPDLTLQVEEILAFFDDPPGSPQAILVQVLIIGLLLSKYGLIKKAVVKVLLLLLTTGSEPNEVN